MSRQVPLALASPVYDHPRHLKAKKIGHVLTSQAFLPSRLGSPGVRFDDLWPKRAKKPQSGLLSQAWEAQAFIPPLFGAFWPKRAKKPENGLGRQAWEAQACHRNPFRGILAKKHQEIPTQTGMTSLGNPGSSSQSVSRFSGRKKPKNTRTDWDNKPGKPRLVIPVRFGVFRPKKGQQKPETDWDHKPEKAVS